MKLENMEDKKRPARRRKDYVSPPLKPLHAALRELHQIAKVECGHKVSVSSVAAALNMDYTKIYDCIRYGGKEHVLSAIIAEYTVQIREHLAGQIETVAAVVDNFKAISERLESQMNQIKI